MLCTYWTEKTCDHLTEVETDADPLVRATALVERADDADIPLRIIGGLAVRALCPAVPARISDEQDLDLASTSDAAGELSGFLTDRGFEPESRFNAIHGRHQLRFSATEEPLSVDVMLDRLQMCHELDFTERLERLPHTLDAADLLLSKLQIIELNAKDQADAVCLLSSVPVAEGDEPGTIGLDRFGEVVRRDWGWWRTVTGNLEHIIDALSSGRESVPEGATLDPCEQAESLRFCAEQIPKTASWRLRSTIGERMRWYELPEEVGP